jgi:hypothetical protein
VNNRTELSIRIHLALLLLLAFSFAPHITSAQSNAVPQRVSQFVMPLHDEGFIAFKVEASPTAAAGAPKISANFDAIQSALTPQVLLADNHVVHRVLVDAGGNFVFGYDLIVEPVAASKQFKVSLKPLSAEFEERLRSRQPAGATASRAPQNVSTLPRATDAQLIDDGDAFALDLLVNSETGIKIMDVVKVSFDRAKLWSAPQQHGMPLRDFTLGNVELAVREHKLMINGELAGGGRKPARGCAGALLWFYVPERGRFIVSLMPHEGYDFQKIGRIENNKISFKHGDDVYEWTSSVPVVGRSGGNWNLWVLHDPDYVSDFASQEQIVEGMEGAAPPSSGWLRGTLERTRNKPQAEFETRDQRAKRNADRPPRVLVGGADRIENLLPKR